MEGDRIIHKKADFGFDSLTPWETLVYALWVADYAMRNGAARKDANALLMDFQTVALRAAEKLSLPLTRDLFSMELAAFAHAYLDRFDSVCDEIRNAG